MLEQFIRQGYAECERIEGSGQAEHSGAGREIAMIKTKLEEAGALLANAEAKAITGRPLIDLPTLGMIQAFHSGDVDDQVGGPFSRDSGARPGEAATTAAGAGGGQLRGPGGGESQR